MTCYVTYWPYYWVKTILANGDTGPLSIIYGVEHRSQPPLGKVSVGDVVFPVTLSEGQLYILARMTISSILSADEYTEEALKITRNPFVWDSYTAAHIRDITHYIPRTCADVAALGTDGTAIALRPVPFETISQIKLGSKVGAELPLKMRGDKISINNFSGYFRRLSECSANLFEVIIRSV